MKNCSISGCAKPSHSRTWCRFHWQRWYRYGDPLVDKAERIIGNDQARFWSKVDRDHVAPAARPDLGNCWVWTAGLNEGGYGYFDSREGANGRRKRWLAHRWSFFQERGFLPDGGLQLDHLCRTRACVRPSHLEPVTPQENCLRGISPAAQQARQTACLNGGHALRTMKSGRRYCPTCARESSLKRYREKNGIPLDAPLKKSRPRSIS